jgi:hypothetical protein
VLGKTAGCFADVSYQCNGVRPKCNTCQFKNFSCIYGVSEDRKTAKQLRAQVTRLVKELNDLKSILPLLVMAPNWAMAANWAKELEKNGFAQHSAKDIKQSLQVRVFRKNVSGSVLISRRMSTNNNPKYWNKIRKDSNGVSCCDRLEPVELYGYAVARYGGQDS